jgi:hypothetical protein
MKVTFFLMATELLETDVPDVADDSASISWCDGKSSALLSAAALLIVPLAASDSARGRCLCEFAATR